MDFKQLIVQHTMRSKDRVFREAEADPINEIVASRLEQEFTGALIFVLVDLLDSTGVASKEAIQDLMEKRLAESENARAMMEVAKRLMSNMPQVERNKFYDKFIDGVMNGKPDERPNT